MRRGRNAALGAALVALVAAGAAGQPQPQPYAADAVSLAEGFAPVAARVAPAVVSVAATKTASAEELPFPFDAPRGRRARGIGSGVVVSADGTILTNNHVVEDAERVRVTLADGRELTAEVVGADPPTDVAVLRVKATGLTALPFGDSREVRVGQFALAVGNPFGLGQTVTLGIISATGRGEMGIVEYEDFLQTDAAINPGNSGGALVNHRGELIGLPTALATPGLPGNVGVGFAVPSHMARAVMQQILAEGRVVRGWLGVSIQELTPPLATALGLPEAGGALVAEVVAETPAARAGLRRGDVIVAIDGEGVKSGRELRNRIAATAPGTRVTLGLVRGSARRDVEVSLGELPAEQASAPPPNGREPSAGLGVELAPLSEPMRRRLQLPTDAKGVLVTDVDPGSAAAEAGLHPGDLIVEAARQPVQDPRDVVAAARKAGDEPLLLLVRRGRGSRYVLLEP